MYVVRVRLAVSATAAVLAAWPPTGAPLMAGLEMGSMQLEIAETDAAWPKKVVGLS